MSIVLDGTTGITTPGLTNTGTETLVNLTTTGNTTLGDASTDTLNVGNGGLVKDASGNVGIGTASPSTYGAKLAVIGGDVVIDNGYAIRAGTAGNSLVQRGTGSAAAISLGSGTAGDYLVFNAGGTERMRIDTSGNLGLGVTPSAWDFGGNLILPGAGTYIASQNVNLYVAANVRYSGAAEKYVATNPATKYVQGSGTHVWYNAPSGTAGNAITFTQAMTLDASGQLMIGATSASGILYALGSSSNGYATISDGTGTILIGGSNAVTGGGVTGANGAIRTAGNLIFCSGGAAEKMRLDSSGNLLVGTTSVYATNSKVSIAVSNSTSHGMTFRPIDANTAYRAVNFNNFGGSANVGYIDCSTTATTYSTSSDYRLKENVQPMTNALAKVAELKPVTYDWISDKSKGQGFIAHELQAVVPECVVGEKDAVDAEGNPVYQGIDTSFLVATLTAAIQEQQALIQSLTDRITQLENK